MKAVLPASISRRGFLKNSITGAAVFGVAPHLFLPTSAAGVREGSCPHPNIDGLRVVGVHDPGMTREVVPVCPWTHQEGLVVARAVEENMDRMAMALTGEKQVRDAWKAILLKPPGKAWSDVVVAIKTNNIARQHTRSAVMAKMCRVLVEEMNVRGAPDTNLRRQTWSRPDRKDPLFRPARRMPHRRPVGRHRNACPAPLPLEGGNPRDRLSHQPCQGGSRHPDQHRPVQGPQRQVWRVHHVDEEPPGHF